MISASRPLGLLGSLLSWRSSAVHVSKTQIFARREANRQALIYSMQLSSRSDAVMVLPLPVDRDFAPADDAVEFVGLDQYPDIFDDLRSAFPQIVAAAARSKSQGFSLPSLPPLKVHRVGAFDASYVPTLADFDRLDARFRLPSRVWDELPVYEDYGFAVFKLGKGRKNRIHPMAFWFRTREPDSLFFPTVHVHDRTVHARARFDHELYFQLPLEPPPGVGAMVTANAEPAQARFASDISRVVDMDRCRGLLSLEDPLGQLGVYGTRDNTDYRVSAGTGT